MKSILHAIALSALVAWVLVACSKEESAATPQPQTQVQKQTQTPAGIDPFKQVLENQNKSVPSPAVVLQMPAPQKSADPFKDFADSKK